MSDFKKVSYGNTINTRKITSLSTGKKYILGNNDNNIIPTDISIGLYTSKCETYFIVFDVFSHFNYAIYL